MEVGAHALRGNVGRQRNGVILMGMNATRRDKTEKMGGSARGQQLVDEGVQLRDLLKFAAVCGVADARQVLHDHAARADVEMADFRIAHLPAGQADVLARGVQEGMGVLRPELVEGGCPRLPDGIVGRILAPAPTV